MPDYANCIEMVQQLHQYCARLWRFVINMLWQEDRDSRADDSKLVFPVALYIKKNENRNTVVFPKNTPFAYLLVRKY